MEIRIGDQDVKTILKAVAEQITLRPSGGIRLKPKRPFVEILKMAEKK